MKKFEVVLTLAVALSEDFYEERFEIEGADKEDIFSVIILDEWFKYEKVYKSDGVEKSTATYIQVKHIQSIFIREIKEPAS